MDDGRFVNGKHHGEWRSYYPDGKLWRVEVYQMGTEVGVWREWNEDGELVSEQDHGGAP
jgi:antitoxin component YwqK of YwqJK toxin-antitoxin module